MSPFDVFVLAVFLLATIKASVDTVLFWREAEELAQMHFRTQEAAARAAASRTASSGRQNKNNRQHITSEFSPKHLRVPCRPARVPAGRVAGSSAARIPDRKQAITKSRAVRTGLGSGRKSSNRQTRAA